MHLVKLRLSGCDRISDAGIDFIISNEQNNNNAENYNSNDHNNNNNVIDRPYLPCLEELSVRGCNLLSEQCITNSKKYRCCTVER